MVSLMAASSTFGASWLSNVCIAAESVPAAKIFPDTTQAMVSFPNVPEFIALSRRTGAILTQNIALAIGIKVIFFSLALGGVATMWMAVIADVGASLLVVGNGLRPLRVAHSRSRAKAS